ncbi:hypothetical protein Q31b_42450 [Novipirellula aureliae]|uniref:Uncharacterized protein n=1 Tax=Novipirellula aureliae TaxID=2527966 RepID=A0A5C6DQQ0_9BACT|nr:hypothetical protein [Novipirellula aureliae]TWU39160.1 hypothetical protein Q31b_42450 [Novipirellula aureliae]
MSFPTRIAASRVNRDALADVANHSLARSIEHATGGRLRVRYAHEIDDGDDLRFYSAQLDGDEEQFIIYIDGNDGAVAERLARELRKIANRFYRLSKIVAGEGGGQL